MHYYDDVAVVHWEQSSRLEFCSFCCDYDDDVVLVTLRGELFLISWPNGSVFLNFFSYLKSCHILICSYLDLEFLVYFSWSFNIPFLAIIHSQHILKIVQFVNHTAHCVDLNSYPEASLLGPPSFSSNSWWFLCFTPVILGLYSIPDLSPLFSESLVFLLYGLHPHFAGVPALESSSEMACER